MMNIRMENKGNEYKAVRNGVAGNSDGHNTLFDNPNVHKKDRLSNATPEVASLSVHTHIQKRTHIRTHTHTKEYKYT